MAKVLDLTLYYTLNTSSGLSRLSRCEKGRLEVCQPAATACPTGRCCRVFALVAFSTQLWELLQSWLFCSVFEVARHHQCQWYSSGQQCFARQWQRSCAWKFLKRMKRGFVRPHHLHTSECPSSKRTCLQTWRVGLNQSFITISFFSNTPRQTPC